MSDVAVVSMENWSAGRRRKARENAWLRSPAADALDDRVQARALELLRCGPELASEVALCLCRSTAEEPAWYANGALTDAELRAIGEELSQRVVQHYVYQRLKEEIQAREFVILEDEVDANNAIHMKVRHWQSAA